MKHVVWMLFGISLLALTGCSSAELSAPCPNFGNSCHQTPLNSWDYNQ